uniref:Sperm flagellar protein 2-like n=1 Tax=Phallusia mammillata TaxID=59560 RepID=A0A6F9DU25_9ASCI|nr:sperm flagellar protein 2-like [Phallusia mammillata]
MTDILCKWINEEVKLSKDIGKSTFAEDFASGYYIGEILHKFQLQDDFDKFSKGYTADAKLNNFTRLEPTLHLLQIPFDTNIAYNVMIMKHGIATRLLYQLYVALQRKVKSNLTGAAMQTMRAPAPVKLEQIESGLYKERLKTLLPRESDLTLDKVSANFEEKLRDNERKAMTERYKDMERFEKVKQENRQAALEKSRVMRQKQTELLAKIQAATVHIPKPPPTKTLKAMNQKREARRKIEAENVVTEIAGFEKKLKKLVAPTSSQNDDSSADGGDLMMESSVEYLKRIKNRLEEDATAREERAKRRRKVLVDQMKAHHSQEESLRQEQVVQRLMRQSQQERRIAVQLMQARREKDTIRKNRIFQEQQVEARRLKDFKEALDREAELCKLARQDYEDEIKRESELHNKIMAERSQVRYRRHYNLCQETLNSIVDFSCKIAEYRLLTDKKVPDKLVREWRELLMSGKPLYKTESEDQIAEIQNQKDETLDNLDFTEYQNLIGEWLPGDDMEKKPVPTNNNILGHILHRMFSIVAPTPPPSPRPVFPEFPVRTAVLGKMFSGKTTLISRLVNQHRLVRLAVDHLLSKSVEAFQNGELSMTPRDKAASAADILVSVTSITIEPPTPAHDDNKDGGLLMESAVIDDGEEKKDPEKEFSGDESVVSTDREAPILSTRAKLGQHALKYLKKGKPVPDSVLVEIVTEAIRKIPEGTGWVLDGFPVTSQQAVLLEKALTGNDVSVDVGVLKKKNSKKSSLVQDPKPAKSQPPAPGGLDVIIALDISDELVLKRSSGRTQTIETGELFHEEFRSPPHGSRTGIEKVEKVVPVVDPAFDKEQVQHRISNYHDNWPKLEKLYGQISIVRHVDAEAECDVVFSDLEKALFETLRKIQNKGMEEAAVEETGTKSVEIEKKSEKTQPSPEKEASRPASAVSKKSKRSSQSPDSKSPKSSARGRNKSADKSEKGKSRSRSASGKSSKGKKKSRSPTPVPPPEPVEEEVVGPPKPQPGDPDWEYVNEDLPFPLVHACVPYWENAEFQYLKNTKFIFRAIRNEREDIIRYMYEVRKDFREHLRRPDHKQAFVTPWQQDYNEIPDDLRDDEETKAELHQRLDDLRERLWDICDTRKEEMEAERNNLMTEGWMEDHLGLLTNHYLTLMQSEIDRFQDTVRVVKDYYAGMQTKPPAEVKPAGTFPRMPLVDLGVGQDASAVQSSTTVGSDGSTVSPQASQTDAKKVVKKPSDESTAEDSGTVDLASAGESRTKIPLMQRGAPISSMLSDDAAKGKKGKGAPPAGSESPVQDVNLEEKTISEGFNFAVSVVTTSVQTCISEKEAEEEEERRLKDEEEKAKAAQANADKKAAGGGGKKGGGKSAKGKKGKGGKSKSPTPTPPTPVEEESEEVKKKRETAVRLRDEYFAVLQQEEISVKEKLDIIKRRATTTLGDLRTNSEQSFTDMLDWLGARYLREMGAIDNLSNVAREHIEAGEKMKHYMKLEQDEFIIDLDVKVVRTPSPPLRHPAVETTTPDSFTVVQIEYLLTQFKKVAPSGLLTNKAFTELLADTAAVSYGADILPDMWMSMTYSQLVDLCGILSPESQYIDWRKFLLIASQPYSRPSAEGLLRVRQDFANVDIAMNGWISEDQYNKVELWFSANDEERPVSPEDPEDPYPYNRDVNLRHLYFKLFADWEQMPPRLDYVNMLMYFAMDRDPLQGVFRALSVAAGKPMPRVIKRVEGQAADKESEVAPEDAVGATSGDGTSMQRESHLEVEAIPQSTVSPQAWWLVLHHGSSRIGDSHRFSVSEDPEEKYSMEHIRALYNELGAEDQDAVPIQTLMRHPVFEDAVCETKRHGCPDIRSIFTRQTLQALDADDAQSDQT